MASRMDRYNKSELVNSERSTKYKSLYDEIDNLKNYTNIEGVATIDKTNEIDISKVQTMIKNREEYNKKRQLRGIIKEEPEEKTYIPEVLEETKTYDIKDLLSKIERDINKENNNRKLDREQYEVIQELNSKDKKIDFEKEEEELKELIHTINATKALKELNNTELDVGLFDELKSDTMVGDASSIKKILEEEKNAPTKEDTTTNIDKDFYTSSFGFTKSDFEDLKSINQNIKKSNKLIIVLLFTFIALVIIIGLVLFFLNK